MNDAYEKHSGSDGYLTVSIAEQRFGIPVLHVQDVLRKQKTTRIPLAPPEVAGALNLRGRIATAINVRRCLGLPGNDNSAGMNVIVEQDDELYSLIIDSVGDVINLRRDDFNKNPEALDQKWCGISSGIYQLENELLIIMDVSKLLGTIGKE